MTLRGADVVLLDVLYPQRAACLLCHGPSRGAWLCGECRMLLKTLRVPEPVCPRCGRPLDAPACTRCDGAFPVTRSAYLHEEEAGRLVRMLKDHPVEGAAHPLAEGMAEALASLALPEDVLLTWAPMSDRRRRQRGIDHARTLAGALGALLDKEPVPLLRRSRDAHTQRGLSGAERRKNLRGVMEAVGAIHQPVLVVDDVLTTGATLAACADALREAGCPAVYAVTATQAV